MRKLDQNKNCKIFLIITYIPSYFIMAHIQYVDGLVKEYLLFRGFSNAIKTLDNEIKNDKDKGFRPDKIIDHILSFINSHDLQSLKELWNNLEQNLFNKLEHTFSSAVKKIEFGILKLYLVTAYTNNKPDKISEFFVKLSPELHSQAEWKEWFYFPFCKNPEENITFGIFFTKQWQDTLLISLHNFLAVIFQSVPQPVLSKIENESILIKKLQEENSALRTRIQAITNVLQTSTAATPSSSSTVTVGGQIGDSSRKCKFSKSYTAMQHLDDIVPFDVSPPNHVVDDFYIIASETVNINQITDSQSRGLKSLIRNISSSGSPVLGRKEQSDHNKRRSGSVGRSWV